MSENFNTIIFTSLFALLVNVVAILVEHFIVVPLREKQKLKQSLPASRKEKPRIFTTERLKGGFRNIVRSSFYWVLFLVIILFFVYFAQYYSYLALWLSERGVNFSHPLSAFVSDSDLPFYLNFIGYISVLLGFFLPIVLLRVWEQFDVIDREFDREAEAITILYEDVLLLSDSYYLTFKTQVFRLLLAYTDHVKLHYMHEHEDLSLLRQGNEILSDTRSAFRNLVYSSKKTKESNAILNELLSQLNLLIDIRGDRISFSRKRLFSSLKFILIIISVVWIMPFYLLSYAGVFAYLLVFTLTFLVIFILTVIDDLDDPFHGTWSIFVDPWEYLSIEIQETIHQLVRTSEAVSKKVTL